MNWVVLCALIPLFWRLAAQFLPAQWTEPYAYWDAATLNTPGKDGRLPGWRNMGYWTSEGETFSDANEALARRLLKFADAKHNDRVLDIAHGAGDSLLIHLESNPKHLVAIASLPTDTWLALKRVDEYFIEHAGVPTDMTWYTGSGSFRPNKDFDHPLHPMRGFMGEAGNEAEEEREQVVFSAEDEESADTEKDTKPPPESGPEPYDLVYVLDAVYHFPPSTAVFVSNVLPSLRKGSGVLAYTDVIAPASYGKFPMRMVASLLSTFLRVPQNNLMSGPKTVEEYTAALQHAGYTNVRVEEWTQHVFPGLGANLRARGVPWALAGWLAEKAQSSGWKYVAVRAERPN